MTLGMSYLQCLSSERDVPAVFKFVLGQKEEASGQSLICMTHEFCQVSNAHMPDLRYDQGRAKQLAMHQQQCRPGVFLKLTCRPTVSQVYSSSSSSLPLGAGLGA